MTVFNLNHFIDKPSSFVGADSFIFQSNLNVSGLARAKQKTHRHHRHLSLVFSFFPLFFFFFYRNAIKCVHIWQMIFLT